MIKIKKNAFTLPEVLITLAVVGALAALVLPGLIKDANSRAMTALLQSTVANLNDAVANELVRSRASNIKDTLMYSDPDEFLADSFDVKTVCDVSGDTPCYGDEYTSFNGSTVSLDTFTINPVLLKNGVSVGMYTAVNDDNDILVSVDINGKGEPNIAGVDLFYLYISGATDETVGKHMGDVYGGQDSFYVTGNSELLKSSCKSGNAEACYLLLEISGFDPNYLDKEYNDETLEGVIAL